MNLEDVQPGRPPPKKSNSPAPLLPIALGLILGIVADNALALPGWVSTLMLVTGVLMIVMLKGPSTQRPVCARHTDRAGLSQAGLPVEGRLSRILRRVPSAFLQRMTNRVSKSPRPTEPACVKPVFLPEGTCHTDTLHQGHTDTTGSMTASVIATRLGFVALVVAAAGVGSFRHAIADRRLAENHVVFFTDAEPILAKLRGRILTPPRVCEPPPDVPRPYPIGPKTRFVMEATRIDGLDGPVHVSGKVAVVVRGVLLSLRSGDAVEMTGWIYRPTGPTNPGAYDWALHKRRSGLLVGMSCDHAESVIVRSRGNTGDWQHALGKIRSRLRGYLLDDTFEANEPAAGVLSAMVLGERSAVPQAMNEAFISTGNAHFLAASGMHVAWLALIGWGFCRIFGLYYRTTAVLVGLLIVSYVLLAEPRPSIMRAGIIGVLACATAYARGRYNSVNSLSCAAVIILIIQPADLFRPAFQFSFMATLGLLHFCPLVSKTLASLFLGANLPRVAGSFDGNLYALTLIEPRDRSTSTLAGVKHWLAYLFAQLFALAISEWLITTPLACYHFNRFVPWGWFGSLVLWFFAMPATCLGFLTVLLRLVLPSLGYVMGPLLSWATVLMIWCVELLARMPWTIIDGRSPSLAWLVAVYAVSWLWGYRRRWMPWKKHGFKVCVLILVLWWLVPPRWTRAESDALQVWMLDVGDGTGTVIELPNGKVLLYDFGTRSPYHVGRVATEFLKHRGIRQLDTVFVSHANFDHFSGIEAIAGDFPIGRLVVNDQFERFASERPSARYFLRAMENAGIPIEVTHGRHLFDGMGDVTVEAVWPPPADERLTPDCNESSTVVRITYQDRSILLTGDIAEFGMGMLSADHNVKADVLALPHHGSVVHNTGKFIAAVGPEIAVRSSGQRRAMTINGIEALVGDRRYFNTADDGCILVRIQDGELMAEAVMTHD